VVYVLIQDRMNYWNMQILILKYLSRWLQKAKMHLIYFLLSSRM